MLILARSGYLLQSWALGTSVLELSLAVVYIGDDQRRADIWLRHTDLSRTPWSVKAAAKATAAFFENESLADVLYRRFRQLSTAKHGNPAVLTRYGVTTGQPGTRIQFDPHYSSSTAKLSQLGLIYCLHTVAIALGAFARNFNPDADALRAVLRLLIQLDSKLAQVVTKGAA
jgi:hypothetical protein